MEVRMSIFDLETYLFKLHPEKLSPKITELVELAETKVLNELHPGVAALNRKEATVLQAACEQRLHDLVAVGMPHNPVLEATAKSIERALVNDVAPFDIHKMPIPATIPIPRGDKVHPLVDHVANIVQGGDHGTAYEAAQQLGPDLVVQLRNELKGLQHEQFTSGDPSRIMDGHLIDEWLAPLEVGELRPKKGSNIKVHTNAPTPPVQPTP
jgi:hypothetical protein